ncbi:hypothetical protein [Umezawaea beigongshangensis]|uniref:hypothetical protein n=1 Tax=Umezawaea beigongshangensis TaxID=2780383 RepID=UPI0018F1933B|nr:hypothetical protein [Umezawaea beigongshangensis]
MIVVLSAQAPPNLPAVAALYSQLAGVLAGFGFAGLIALIAAQLTTNHAGRTLESGAPLLAAFLALAVSSLNYAIVAGETAGTARVAALQTTSGLGFSVAGLMLLYSILVLVRGLASDVPRNRATSHAMANLVRTVIVLAVSPLIVLLMWSGVRDHAIQKYGVDAGFVGLDWISMSILLVTWATGGIFAVRLYGKPQHHLRVTRFISIAAACLSSASLLVATALISFTDTSTPIPDLLPAVAIVTVGMFAVLVSYSASRFYIPASRTTSTHRRIAEK